MNVRAIAANVIYEIMVNGSSLSDVLPRFSTELSDSRDHALLQAICYGVCRWFFRINKIAHALLKKPFKQKDLDLYALILVGLYQLIDMRIPHYAVVAETVAATKSLKKIWAKALINGLLREYLRRANEFQRAGSAEAQYSHPRWMIEHLEKQYPGDWENILEANNQHPPLSLRVNQQVLKREMYLEQLSSSGVAAKIIPETHSGIMLGHPLDVEKLPGFSTGSVSVQDGAAQLAVECLMLEPKMRVLDACAAPGGKTAHMLECQPSLECVAVDQNAERLVILRNNLNRLKLSAHCIQADVGNAATWWDGNEFDRILLDAPCSASGVIRRHPDIKLLRRLSDIPKLAETQLRLLKAVWLLLKPGGLLLYATCSIFPEENIGVIQPFLASQPDAREEKIESTWGKDCAVGKQILPGMHHMDGFYFARLRKINEENRYAY